MSNKDTQFKPGNKAGKGRSKGSRNRITKLYLDILRKSIEEHGEEVLERVRKERPEVWVKLLAVLVPKDLDVQHSGNVSIRVVDYADD